MSCELWEEKESLPSVNPRVTQHSSMYHPTSYFVSSLASFHFLAHFCFVLFCFYQGLVKIRSQIPQSFYMSGGKCNLCQKPELSQRRASHKAGPCQSCEVKLTICQALDEAMGKQSVNVFCLLRAKNRMVLQLLMISSSEGPV